MFKKNERESLEKAFKEDAITEDETNSLWEMFIDCNVAIVRTVGYIREITLITAKFVVVQKPFFSLTKIRKGLHSFWDEFSVAQIYLLWNLHKPATTNCLSCFNFDEAISPADEEIACLLKRFHSYYNFPLELQIWKLGVLYKCDLLVNVAITYISHQLPASKH